MSYWCDRCETAEDDHVCSLCGDELEPAEHEPVPWRWRLFMVASVIYLGWRLYQLISWIVH
jgi:uncharacterized paraquat-inducible protein A